MIAAVAGVTIPPAGVADIVVVPAPTPLIGTLTLLDPAGIVIGLVTEAIAALADDRSIVYPLAGATAEALKVKLPVVPVCTLSVSGLKVTTT